MTTLNKKKFIDNLKGPMIEGELEAFSEQGTEGTHWSLYELSDRVVASPYDKLHVLNQGDYLVIFENDEIIWEGKIDLYYKVSGWQRVDGYGTVHGLQKKVKPETWAKWFFERYKAYLIRKVK